MGAPLAVLLLLAILLYQWRWAHKAESAPVSTEAKLGPNTDLGQVADQYDMFVALALRPISDEEIRKYRAGTFGLLRANIKLGAVVAILPATAAVMVITGWVPDLGNGKYVVIVPFILAPLALAWVRYSMASTAESGASLLEPMGLELTAMPEVGIRGSLATGSGMQSEIRGATEMDGERLRAGEGAPDQVAALVDSLGPSPRWRKFKKLEAGPDGLVATRGVDADGGWLWDLWLCERVADALR